MNETLQPTGVPGVARTRTGGAYFEHPKRIYWGQLTGSDATLYTAPSTLGQLYPPKVRITDIWLCNTDSTSRTVTVQVRTGASATATHIMSVMTIAANTVVLIECDLVLEAAEIISGFADVASKVNIRISGREMLPQTVG